MDFAWVNLLLPFFCIMGRVTAFMGVLPLFAWTMVPMRVRLAIALLMSIFFGMIQPPGVLAGQNLHWAEAVLLVSREVLCGLTLGLVARLVFISVQQGMLIGTQQMGFADAGIIDPSTGETQRPVSMLFQMMFAVLFLSVGGHHLLLMAIGRSYEAFPLAQPPEVEALAEGIIQAGGTMFVFALKLAAPMLTGFLLLAVIMGVLAKVMPEMNILMASLPLRVGVGMFLAVSVAGTLNSFAVEIADWLDRYLLPV